MQLSFTPNPLKLSYRFSMSYKVIKTKKNYREVDGILIPSEINLVTPGMPIPGGITIKFGTINLNIKTSDSDFN